jgi:hypothetical protein
LLNRRFAKKRGDISSFSDADKRVPDDRTLIERVNWEIGLFLTSVLQQARAGFRIGQLRSP